MEHSDRSYPEYYEENQSFSDYRAHREPVYNRGGRHDSGYHKETYYRGSYQRGRGESSRYRGSVQETPPKKYSSKPFKGHKKENEIRPKTSTPQSAQKVNHNPGRTVMPCVTLTSEDESETTFARTKSSEDDALPSEEADNPSQEPEMLVKVKEEVKEDSPVRDVLTSTCDQNKETLPALNIKREIVDFKKEDTKQPVAEELMMSVNPGKRAYLEDKDYDESTEESKGESFVGKRPCNDQDREKPYMEKTVQIPLLGCWEDMPSESLESAGPSEQDDSGSAVNCKLPESTKELRTAFILAKKQQLEMAFAQDCKTFAIVASTLLKKDSSLEGAVTRALRTSLQEMAGLCVQELNTFIDHYDANT
ncbi:hypothetical protein GDO78_008454 [Eleutherodactylus coqui]|nr:hypothetical protein GDO78_008454 [Eleutherodactylus coqui]